MAMGIKNRKKIIDAVGALDNFEVGTVRGGWYPTPAAVDLGRLAGMEKAHGWDHLDPDRPVYVVHSYETPIAWRAAGGPWVCPGIHWSVTTSNHQGLVRQGMKRWDAVCDKAVATL